MRYLFEGGVYSRGGVNVRIYSFINYVVIFLLRILSIFLEYCVVGVNLRIYNICFKIILIRLFVFLLIFNYIKLM